jgi:hypothetical protein
MGKHSGEPDPSENYGHPKDVVWSEGADAQSKADNFDAYDNYLVENAPEDNSNPYRKQ